MSMQSDHQHEKPRSEGLKQPQSMHSKRRTKSDNFQTLADGDDLGGKKYHEESVGLVDEEEFVRRQETQIDDTEDMCSEDLMAITKETIFIKEYEYKSLEKKTDLLTAYRYLYRACFRGHIHVANFILHKCRISPFLVDPNHQKSPFMAAIEGNQYLMAKLLLEKDFKCQEKPSLIRD